MYSNNVSIWKNIVSQVKWKLGAHNSAVLTIVIIQLIIAAIANHGSMRGSGLNNMQVTEYIYSLDSVMMVSVVAVAATCIALSSKRTQSDNLAIPTTRLTASISTILFIWIITFITTVTAIVSQNLVQVVKILVLDLDIIGRTLVPSVTVFFVFYFILLCAGAVGYFIGVMFSLSKIVTILSGVLFIVYLAKVEQNIFIWLLDESYGMFMLKILLIAIVFYALALFVNNRQEVRRG